MLLLALALQAASAPAVPPPPEENLRAALALWADHPPEARVKEQAVDSALYAATTRDLAEAGVHPNGGPRRVRRYLHLSERLRPLLARRLPADRTSIDAEAAACIVDQLARALSPEEIAEVRTFMATPTGRKFWSYSVLGYAGYERCYAHALRFALHASDEDYRAIGVKSPERPYARPGVAILP